MRPRGKKFPTGHATGPSGARVLVMMPLSLNDPSLFPLIVERISKLYYTLDNAYSEAAHYYSFHCSGCDRNCCQERFYHYTCAEHIYLAHGLACLGPEARAGIFIRAEEAVRQYRLQDEMFQVGRATCPLNLDGFCVLYEYRPMICRLQGIPHYIRKPGQPRKSGPGCHVFNEKVLPGNLSDFGFDHTPFYSEMAAIEIEIRKRLNYKGRYKKTVAEMLLDMRSSEDRGLQGNS